MLKPTPGAVMSMTSTPNNPPNCVVPRNRALHAARQVRGRRIAARVCAAMLCGCLSAPNCVVGATTKVDTLLLAQTVPGGASADEAAALVREASGGRILGVRRVKTAHGPAYHVKVLLAGGRVRVYVVDVSSGEILR